MKKFNAFESYNLVTGLELLRAAYLADINGATEKGKHHIFTEGYANGIVDDLNVNSTPDVNCAADIITFSLFV